MDERYPRSAGEGALSRAGEWRPSPAAPRVFERDLGVVAGWWLRLFRFAPGATLAIAGVEPHLLFVLDGELIHGGRRLWPGRSAVAVTDAAEGPAHSEVGCTLLVVSPAEDGRQPSCPRSQAVGRSGSGT
ncbi:hypothetical protein KF840_15785 [bacterium]|nr:hypothetical protein [bacterium]